jgi:prepilin-type N-terminal cleavage/methylation domain-containing protein
LDSFSLGQPQRTPISRGSVRAFVLLEILIAMVILGIAMAAVLRCFTNGLKSVSYDRRITQAVLLAQDLLEDFEVEAPEEDKVEGSFAPDFPDFIYVAEFKQVEIKYRDIGATMRKKELEYLRKVQLQIYYQPPSGTKRVSLLDFETYLTGIEKYAPNTKSLNALF